MFISRILYPVKVLGPGDRIGIWMSGCIHHCPGCSNPQLWEQREENRTELSQMMSLVHLISREHPVDGFTITGGDPFFQPDALRELLPQLQQISPDILVYTGYLREKLPEDILKHIAVLIDGRYIQERNVGQVLRGSDNQRIIIQKDEYQATYQEYLKQEHSQIQNFSTRDGIISVGIHLPGYEEALKHAVIDKGLREY